ncbi:WbqC family protein [Halosquirtibacter laminarini]|uniref:WbqC family protein n=1 Tax=Halosquirtibacter laminarini TaxID=3374600 RepID=A0AC61NPK9_9BACT|nr:WbqC family protein [Prolixibacteraceae bacterium]
MKKIAILQSNYIPWKGYFDMINLVDEFILFDEVQFTKRDWRNRNQIKTDKGLEWLTIPCNTKSKYNQSIDQTTVSNCKWREKHLSSLRTHYTKAPFYNEIYPQIEALYRTCTSQYISEINHHFITHLCSMMDINTPITNSRDYPSKGHKSQKLLEICQGANAHIYISGPAAKCYLDEMLFNKNRIEVSWMTYDHYPTYPQCYPEFFHHVSILDLLFNVGTKEAIQHLSKKSHLSSITI